VVAVVTMNGVTVNAEIICQAVERGPALAQQFDAPALIVAADLAAGE